MTGLATTSSVSWTPQSDISSVTGWGAVGGLKLIYWPTVNTLNYRVCNQTATAITPSASVTWNVSAQ